MGLKILNLDYSHYILPFLWSSRRSPRQMVLALVLLSVSVNSRLYAVRDDMLEKSERNSDRMVSTSASKVHGLQRTVHSKIPFLRSR